MYFTQCFIPNNLNVIIITIFSLLFCVSSVFVRHFFPLSHVVLEVLCVDPE